MLKALYDYAIREGLAVPPGYAPKIIKYYISLSSRGDFLGFVPGGEEAVLCPDIGSLANGKDKSNILAEKSSVILAEPSQPKNKFFRNALSEGGNFEPDLLICLKALEDPDTFKTICEEAKSRKIKALDRISFEVDGRSVLKSEAVKTWWADYRGQLRNTKADENKTLCLITGKPTTPVATVPTVTGLSVVGGHSKGDALICFDKNSFCSYNLKQSANAPVSEEAFSYVKAGLDNLLKDAPILSGMKFVHWYDKPVPDDKDILTKAIDDFGIEVEEEEDDNSEEPYDDKNPYEERRLANKKIESITTGENSPALASVYTIMLLSGVNGRVMVRRYEQGSYEDLQKNLDLWNSDLSLVNRSGLGKVKPCKLAGRFTRLLTKQKNDRKIFDRMGKELSGLTAVTLTSIINGTPLPDSAAVRALAYIRSQMLETDDENKTLNIPDPRAVQWLKVWLMRKHRVENKEEFLMEEYNPKHPDTAYHCGALMCVYTNIQKKAMPEINAPMAQRYYASAIQNPALVIGSLSRQSTHHQKKLNEKRYYFWENKYLELLCECYSSIGDSIPATLTLEQQSLFSLGYYQMQAEINRITAERNKNKNNNSDSNIAQEDSSEEQED